MSMRRIGIAAVLGAIAIILALPAAEAETAKFRATPTSGPPGTRILLSSITPCTLPPGVTGQPLIRASLSRGSIVVTATTTAVRPDGSWRTSLTVGREAAAGTDTIDVFCLASPQAEGVLLGYAPSTFTVTPGGGLAGTGYDGSTAGLVSLALIIAGAVLVLAGRRTRPVTLDGNC